MPLKPDSHRANLDSEGNIVLPSQEVVEEKALPIVDDELLEPLEEVKEWEDLEIDFEASEHNAILAYEESTMEASEVLQPMREEIDVLELEQVLIPAAAKPATLKLPDWQKVQSRLADTTHSVLHEGRKQYHTSAKSLKTLAKEFTEGSQKAAHHLWKFMLQPVWIPGRKGAAPKKRSRGSLFMVDVFRFGGTFAGLFSVLFIVLNYQSFWNIIQSRINPLSQAQAAQQLSQEVGGTLKQSGGSHLEGNLLSFLPPVGPPENRIVIPKLDLNVPIVIPPIDSLIREDWKTLEEDIQESLQHGVVHYPGTAHPGQAGNFFLTGHSSYFPWAPGEFKSIFARLHELNPGDEYWVFYNGDRHRYIVQGKKEVKPSDVSVLDQPLSKRISTLMTCTPVGTALRRLIIEAQEVDIETGQALAVGEHEQHQPRPQYKMEALPI